MRLIKAPLGTVFSTTTQYTLGSYCLQSVMSWPASVCLVILVTLTLLGGFTRLTHGRYTPWFYAYQLDRAPDNELTKVIPYVDFAIAAMLLYQSTRGIAAALFALFQFYGVVKRVQEDKNAALDLAFDLCAIFLTLDCLLTG